MKLYWLRFYIFIHCCCCFLVWDLKEIRASPSTCEMRKEWWGTAVLTGPAWSRFRVLTCSDHRQSLKILPAGKTCLLWKSGSQDSVWKFQQKWNFERR